MLIKAEPLFRCDCSAIESKHHRLGVGIDASIRFSIAKLDEQWLVMYYHLDFISRDYRHSCALFDLPVLIVPRADRFLEHGERL